jgi:hypothetical protein
MGKPHEQIPSLVTASLRGEARNTMPVPARHRRGYSLQSARGVKRLADFQNFRNRLKDPVANLLLDLRSRATQASQLQNATQTHLWNISNKNELRLKNCVG